MEKQQQLEKPRFKKVIKIRMEIGKIPNTFGVNDLPELVLVATKAYDYLTLRKEEQ